MNRSGKSKVAKAGKSKASKSLLNPMVLAATLSSIMRSATANHFTRQATIDYSKKKRQHKEYVNAPTSYLEESIKNMNSALNTNKPVQSGKAVLEKHVDIRSKSHPFHYGMPSEDKKIYTAKREELLRKISLAKEKRATNKLLSKNLNSSKRSKLNDKAKQLKHERQRGHRGHRGL
jgi:hypothetical protein